MRRAPARAAGDAAAGANKPPAPDAAADDAQAGADAAPEASTTRKKKDEAAELTPPPALLDEAKRKQAPAERAIPLIMEACTIFGINPDPHAKPRELADWRYSPGDPHGALPVPEHVSMVTSGGLKIQYPLDDASEERLRITFKAFRIKRDTDGKEVREVLPLPEDLTLPREAVDGLVRSSEHQYRTGYLREGGAGEAARRDLIRSARAQGRLGK